MKKIYMFEWIPDVCKQDSVPVFKILIFRIRMTMDRIRNPDQHPSVVLYLRYGTGYLQNKVISK